MSVRLFAALALPEDVAAQAARLQRGVGGARWSPRENLHLTLSFYGEAPEPQADELDAMLEHVALARAGFDLQLKGAGVFGGADPNALYLGVAPNAALMALAEACARAGRRTGLKPDARKYTPHVTLAYLRRPEIDRVIGFVRTHALFASRAWRVDRFGLYSSQVRDQAPSLYRLEAEYRLR